TRQKTVTDRLAKLCDHFRIRTERAIPDHLMSGRKLEVEARQAVDIDAHPIKIVSYETRLEPGAPFRAPQILSRKLSIDAHGRQGRPVWGSQALYTPPFLIDQDGGIAAAQHIPQAHGQLGKLRRAFDIAAEDYEAGRLYLAEEAFLPFGEGGAFQAEEDGGRRGHLVARERHRARTRQSCCCAFSWAQTPSAASREAS